MQPLPVVLLLLVSVCLTSALEPRFISANGTFADRKNYSTISVNNGGPWGYWTWIDKCPDRSYGVGFSLKAEPYGGTSDDTSLNGIRLYCSSNLTGKNVIYYIESDTGKFGNWSEIIWCPHRGILKSFQLKVERPQGSSDDTAVNNINFRCSTGAIEGVGGEFGEYAEWSKSCSRGGICGIQTKQEPYQGIFIDDTALNDVRFFCCE